MLDSNMQDPVFHAQYHNEKKRARCYKKNEILLVEPKHKRIEILAEYCNCNQNGISMWINQCTMRADNFSLLLALVVMKIRPDMCQNKLDNQML